MIIRYQFLMGFVNLQGSCFTFSLYTTAGRRLTFSWSLKPGSNFVFQCTIAKLTFKPLKSKRTLLAIYFGKLSGLFLKDVQFII